MAIEYPEYQILILSIHHWHICEAIWFVRMLKSVCRLVKLLSKF